MNKKTIYFVDDNVEILQELKNANYITRCYKSYIKLNPASIRFLEKQSVKTQTGRSRKH